MEEDHITSYDPRWDKGLMRHLIVRTAVGTGEVMVILVINGKAIPNAPKLVRMLDEAIAEIPVYEDGPLAGVAFNLESVVVNIHKLRRWKGRSSEKNVSRSPASQPLPKKSAVCSLRSRRCRFIRSIARR